MNPRHTKAKDTASAKAARKAAHTKKKSALVVEPVTPAPAADIVRRQKNFFDTDIYKKRELKFRNSALKREVAQAQKRLTKLDERLEKLLETQIEAQAELDELQEMLDETQSTESLFDDTTAEEMNEEDGD